LVPLHPGALKRVPVDKPKPSARGHARRWGTRSALSCPSTPVWIRALYTPPRF